MKRAPVSPDEATQRDQVRRFLDLLTGAALVSGLFLAAQGVATGNDRTLTIAVVVVGFAVLLVAWPRRMIAHGRVESAVTVMALATTALIVGSAVFSPSGALIAATSLLIPITAAVPYLEVKSLRRLMIVAWVATIATAAASLLPDPAEPSASARG